jgi:predicted nucleotidyltransferase
MTLLDTLQEKRVEILQVAARHGAFNVPVFGSVVQGEETPESDIDFLVDYDLEKITPWFPGGLLMESIFLVFGFPLIIAWSVPRFRWLITALAEMWVQIIIQ